MAISRTPRHIKQPMIGQAARVCEVCGKAYRPYIGSQRICRASDCVVAYKRRARQERDAWRQTPRPCQTCGQPFTPTRSTHLICSEACRNKRWRVVRPKTEHERVLPIWEADAIDRKFAAALKMIRARRQANAIDQELRWNSALHGL